MADNLNVTPGSGAIVAAEEVGGVLFQKVYIGRNYTIISVTIPNGTAESEEMDWRPYAGGIVWIPNPWTDANLGFKISPTTGGTFTNLRDYFGAPVQISGIAIAEVHPYQIPEELFSAGFVKLWSKDTTAATETDNNQGGDRVLTVALKG